MVAAATRGQGWVRAQNSAPQTWSRANEAAWVTRGSGKRRSARGKKISVAVAELEGVEKKISAELRDAVVVGSSRVAGRRAAALHKGAARHVFRWANDFFVWPFHRLSPRYKSVAKGYGQMGPICPELRTGSNLLRGLEEMERWG